MDTIITVAATFRTSWGGDFLSPVDEVYIGSATE